MEGLRAQARDNFLASNYCGQEGPGNVIQLTTIRKYVSGDTSIEKEEIRSTEIVHRVTQPLSQYQDRDVVASLQLVRLDRGETSNRLCVDESTFLQLFEALRLDQYSLQLLINNARSFYQLPRRLAQSEDSKITNFYLNSVQYNLLWSYDSADASTRVLLLNISEIDQQFYDLIYRNLVEILDYHIDLAQESCFFSFACAVCVVRTLDHVRSESQLRILKIMAKTGHGWNQGIPTGDRPTTSELAEMSKEIGLVQSILVGNTRTCYIAKDLFEELSSVATSSPHNATSLVEALTVLEQGVNQVECLFSYLRELARIQQSVVSSSAWKHAHTSVMIPIIDEA